MPGQPCSFTEASSEASASTRNPFLTQRHSLRREPGPSALAQSWADDPPVNASGASNVLSGAANVDFYGPAGFNQARGNIIHIHNRPSYLPGLEAALPNESSALRLAPSQPYVSSLPGSETANNAAKTYTQLMMHQGHGYPLWNPKPPDDLPAEYRTVGVRIGDVGVVTSDGVFDYAFNIYLPAEHPINFGRTPPNFEPLTPYASIRADGDKWNARSCITSLGVDCGVGTDGRYIFECGGCEGAALVLHDGASREDARDLGHLRDYASVYAVGWYQYLITRCRWEVANGSLYIITGCDKTSTWGTAAFNTGFWKSFRMVFSPGDTVIGSAPTWDEPSYATASSGRSTHLDERSQCIFLRGFRATLQPRFWAEISYSVEITSIEEANRGWGDYISRCLSFLAIYLWFLNYFGPEETLKRSLRDAKNDSAKLPAHPSEIIGLDLLKKVPDAKLALTHDSTYWWSERQKTTLARPQQAEILAQVYGEYNIQRRGDVIWPIKKEPVQNAPGGLLSRLSELWRSRIIGETIIEVSNEQERLLTESPGRLYTDPPPHIQPPQSQPNNQLIHNPDLDSTLTQALSSPTLSRTPLFALEASTSDSTVSGAAFSPPESYIHGLLSRSETSESSVSETERGDEPEPESFGSTVRPNRAGSIKASSSSSSRPTIVPLVPRGRAARGSFGQFGAAVASGDTDIYTFASTTYQLNAPHPTSTPPLPASSLHAASSVSEGRVTSSALESGEFTTINPAGPSTAIPTIRKPPTPETTPAQGHESITGKIEDDTISLRDNADYSKKIPLSFTRPSSVSIAAVSDDDQGVSTSQDTR